MQLHRTSGCRRAGSGDGPRSNADTASAVRAPLVGPRQFDISGADADAATASSRRSSWFGKPRPLRSSILPQTGAIAGELDEVSCEGIPLQRRGEFSAAIGQTLRLIGWAVDTIGPRLTGGIEIQIDGVAIVETQTSLARGDVAAQHGSRGVSDCGFDCRFRVPNLRLGMHALVVSRPFGATRRSTDSPA